MHELNLNNIAELTHELTYYRYILNQGRTDSLFRDLALSEYVALDRVARSISEKGDAEARTYLQDLAETLKLSIPQTSKMIGRLRDKGLVIWSHDGNGTDGTYVSITESGVQAMERQEMILKDYYGRVINRFGRENMAKLLRLMIQLEKDMDAELSEKGEEADGV